LTEPEITVVIPVWDDYVRFLSEAVQSVRQDVPDTPIVLVDNASDPPLSEIEGCSLVRSDRRLSVGAARNLGIGKVSTPYVLVLDADDRLLPGTLPLLREEMNADPSLSICATLIVDGRTGERHRNPRRPVSFLTRSRRGFAFLECVWSFVPIQGCAAFRTAQVLDCGGYPDADWGDDWVLAMSLSFRGRVGVQPHLGRYYRATDQSLRSGRGIRDDLASAGLVRRRIVEDASVAVWARAALPLIWLLQMTIVFIARPLLRGTRRLTTRD
jgi:glycosyltransferase involved in cell wall biosynthesis